MTKYKEMYDWEKAAHYATEHELQKFKVLYGEMVQKYSGLIDALQNIIEVDDPNPLIEVELIFDIARKALNKTHK